MKQQISRPVLITAITIVVLLVALIGWKVLSSSSPEGGDPETLKTAQALKAKRDGGN